MFKSGFVQKLRSRLFWPRRRNTRRSNYAPLSGQSNHNGSSHYHSNNQSLDIDFDENDEFNTINEQQPKRSRRRIGLPSMNFSFKRKEGSRKPVIGGGGLDDRYRQQTRGSGGLRGGLSKFLDVIGMSTPRDTQARQGRHGYANVEFEGEF